MKQLGIRPLIHYYNRLGREESYHIIAGRLLQNISSIHNMSIREVAALCYTSEASISRLSRKAGYEGFNDLREQAGNVSKNYYTENRLIQPEQLRSGSSVSVYLSAVRDLLNALENSLTEELMARAAELLHEAGQIYYFGACDTFVRLEQDLCISGKFVDVCQDVRVQDLPELPANSLVILENPGYPWFQMNDMAQAVRQSGAKLLLITCAAGRDLEPQADAAIVLSGTKSGQDEFLFQSVMNILSLEYRKRYMDGWFYD